MHITHRPTIVGCSSGFGRRLALIALARGDLVIASARSVDKLSDLPKSDSLHLLQLDVCGGPEILNAKLNEAVNVWGRIDFCVNNAGTGMKGLVEESGQAISKCFNRLQPDHFTARVDRSAIENSFKTTSSG